MGNRQTRRQKIACLRPRLKIIRRVRRIREVATSELQIFEASNGAEHDDVVGTSEPNTTMSNEALKLDSDGEECTVFSDDVSW